jgi:hypothetical protein
VTRLQVLGLGLPAWTLFAAAWLFFGGASLDGAPLCLRLIGRSAACADEATRYNLELFYLGTVPWVGAILGGYLLLGMLTVRARRGRFGLTALWFAVVIAFAIVGRPEPTLPYLG